MSDSHESEIDHHVKIYMRVFLALMVLTVVTVAASYIELSVAMGIALALFIALVKGSLVACYFMHLISERKMIYWALLLTFFFFLVLLSIPSFWAGDHITY
jgi:cytochrome c oxidase subunit 4